MRGEEGAVVSGRSIRPPKQNDQPEGSALLVRERKKKLPIGYPLSYEGDEHQWAKQSGSRSL